MKLKLKLNLDKLHEDKTTDSQKEIITYQHHSNSQRENNNQNNSSNINNESMNQNLDNHNYNTNDKINKLLLSKSKSLN